MNECSTIDMCGSGPAQRRHLPPTAVAAVIGMQAIPEFGAVIRLDESQCTPRNSLAGSSRQHLRSCLVRRIGVVPLIPAEAQGRQGLPHCPSRSQDRQRTLPFVLTDVIQVIQVTKVSLPNTIEDRNTTNAH